MKAIKINAANVAAIQAALLNVNGRALSHTFTALEIIIIAEAAEVEALGLLGNKKDVIGATMFARSGDKLPNAYKYGRQVNQITIERRSRGWWLIELVNYTANDKSAAYSRLTLTAEQDAKAVARFKKSYGVE